MSRFLTTPPPMYLVEGKGGGGKKTVMTESIHRACLPAWFPPFVLSAVRPSSKRADVCASRFRWEEGVPPPPPPPPPPSAAPSLRPSPHLCGSSYGGAGKTLPLLLLPRLFYLWCSGEGESVIGRERMFQFKSPSTYVHTVIPTHASF